MVTTAIQTSFTGDGDVDVDGDGDGDGEFFYRTKVVAVLLGSDWTPSGPDAGPKTIPFGLRNRLRRPPRTRGRHPRDPERSSARTR